MSDDAPRARARAIALRQLAARARTEAQLRARLSRDGLDAEADATVAWLRGLGYLDDAAYARARARGLVAPGRLGPRLAERRLQGEGIPAAEARAAVAAALAEEGGDARAAELERCRDLLARRSRAAAPAELDERGLRRLSRFLLGRGFSPSVVARVLGVREDRED
jgi:regulatory protein